MTDIENRRKIRTCCTVAMLVVLSSFAGRAQVFSGNLPPPTPSQIKALQNIRLLESKMVLDHDQYLPKERMVLTVTIRNPTDTPLEVPVPFQSGACYLIFEPDRSKSPGGGPGPDNDIGGYFADVSDPTVVLGPGKEVERTVTTTPPMPPWVPLDTPRTPGWYRVVYGYDDRIHADFQVVAPTKLWAISILHLPPTEEMNYEAGRPTVKSAVVPFLVVETLPGEYWLFRGDPRRRELTQWPLREYTLDVLYSQIPYFERVKRLDEPVTSLQTELRADNTVDVQLKTASGREQWVNVPSAPTKKPTPAQ
jgi:hypothetical protein